MPRTPTSVNDGAGELQAAHRKVLTMHFLENRDFDYDRERISSGANRYRRRILDSGFATKADSRSLPGALGELLRLARGQAAHLHLRGQRPA